MLAVWRFRRVVHCNVFYYHGWIRLVKVEASGQSWFGFFEFWELTISSGSLKMNLAYKTFIERLSQYWLVRGAFSVEAPGRKRNVFRERQDVAKIPDINLARRRGGRPFLVEGPVTAKARH